MAYDLEDLTELENILPWRIPWTEQAGRLQFMGLQTVTTEVDLLALTHMMLCDQNMMLIFSHAYLPSVCVCMYVYICKLPIQIFCLFLYWMLVSYCSILRVFCVISILVLIRYIFWTFFFLRFWLSYS